MSGWDGRERRTGDRRIPDLVVRGRTEHEILAHAPVMTCDRVHWAGPDTDMSALARSLPMRAWTRQWSDGLHRIWVEEGRGDEARAAIALRADTVNLRVDRSVPFRDLSAIPDDLLPELIAAAVAWLYPRTGPVRRKLIADLDLLEDEDVRSMMYLFCSDQLDRFDPRRGGRLGSLNVCAYLLGKIRTWPQDASRSAYGRTAVDEQLAVNRAYERFVHEARRAPSEAELAEAAGITVDELRRRRSHATAIARTRFTDVIDEALDVADGTDVAEEASRFASDAAITRSVIEAARSPLDLAAVYLSFWQERTRGEIADELRVSPKVAGSAITRTVAQLGGLRRVS